MSGRCRIRVVDDLVTWSWPECATNVVPVDRLPATPFDVSTTGMTVTAVVDDPEVAVQVVMAAVRGADLVIEVRLAGADRLAFLDELNRVGTVPVDGSPTVGRLSPEQFALLDGLARGRSLTEMCRELGLSRRTATRRLADARARLGVSTTVEAAVRRESARRPRSG